MRVGLNLLYLTQASGGMGRYAMELVPALAAADPSVELVAYAGAEVPEELVARTEGRITWVRTRARPDRRSHLLTEFAGLPADAIRRRLDVVHHLATVGAVRIPRVRGVVTLHDLLWLHVPDEWGTSRAARVTRFLALAAARNADRCVAVSHYTKQDFVRHAGLDAGRIDVAPHGAAPPPDPGFGLDAASARQAFELGDAPVVLCVAQKRRYKNGETLVRALTDLPGAILVLPGARTPEEDRLRAIAAELGVGDRVRWPPYVSDEELEGLYRAATVVALPSRLEGFGLPILEAMVRGVPVACSSVTAMAEVAGDAALTFDPQRPAEVVDALSRLLSDEPLRRTLTERGRERAAGFTWERSARATLDAYRRAVG